MIKKLYYSFFLILSDHLQKAVKLFLFLLCFSSSLNILNKSKSGIEFFSLAFAEEAIINKEQAAKAVWSIRIGNSSGTGFFISENKIVTNYHVIQKVESVGLENIRLVQEGDPEQLKVKKIVSLSILDDLAVLEVEGEVSHFLNLPSENVLNSNSLYALGYPRGKFQEISQTGVFIEDGFFGNHSNAEGVSGGPVLNESHQLVGLVNLQFNNFLSFISIKTLRYFIESEIFLCKSLNIKACFESSREIFIKSMQEVKEAGGYFKIAMVFYRGVGVKKDLFSARKSIEESAEQGFVIAQHGLAVMYYEGEGGERDVFSARKWMEESAEQGFAIAQHGLAVMYYEGIGVERDFFSARKWMEESAEQGYSPAQYDLAKMYYYGEGVEKDLSQVIKWMRKSAEQGYSPAQYELANVYYKGEGVEKDLSQVIKWLKKSAALGYAPAQYSLANMYYKGEGVEKDISKATEWLKKAFVQGYVPSQKN